MLIIAHRGASGEYPENSILALEKAIEQGADGIEIDLQYHQPSGEFIVFHDRNLLRLTGKTGNINNYTLDELLKTSIGKNQHIITLAQAIALIPKKLILNLELKVSTSEQLLIETLMQKLQQVLNHAVSMKHITWPQLYISSFNHFLINYGKTLLPKANFAALIAHCPLNYATFSETMALASINQDIDCLNQELVSDIHRHGLTCWVFTVDDIDDIKQCLALNVDAIFTNFPQRTREIIRQIQQ